MRAVSRGVRFVLGDRVLRGLLFSTAIFNFGTGMMLAQLVLFATENLGLGALGFGAFQAVGNAGFVLGALLVDRLDRRLGTGGVVLLSAGCGAAAMLLVALSATVGGIPVLLVGRLIGAFAAPLFNVTLVTVRQTRSPERLQARVAATFRAIDWGTAPVGSLASGIVGVALGVPAVMVAAGAFGVLSIPFAVSGVRALGTTALEAMTPAGSEPSLEPAPLTTVVEAG
jgi:MFS family permease